MVPVKPIIEGLYTVGQKAGPALKALWKNKKVQEIVATAIGSIIGATTAATLEKIQDKELSVKKKLKLLNKLKKKGEISEEEYRKHYDRILNSL